MYPTITDITVEEIAEGVRDGRTDFRNVRLVDHPVYGRSFQKYLGVSDGDVSGDGYKDKMEELFGEVDHLDVRGSGFYKMEANYLPVKLVGNERTALTNCSLRYSDIPNSKLEYSHLDNSDLTGANLAGSNFVSASMSEVGLDSVNAKGASFSSARLHNASLRNADLSDSSMGNCILYDADLTGADLTGASLTLSELRNADFSEAILNKTDLRSSSIELAYTSSTKFRKAIVTMAEKRAVMKKRPILHGRYLDFGIRFKVKELFS